MTTKQEQFIQDLVQFYRNRGIASANSSQFVARLNGKNVDLSELYSSVIELGGSYKVNQFNHWDEIYFKLFKTNFIGANFAVALRQIYNRYLLQYEKSCNGNFNNEPWNEDADDDENAIFHNSNSQSSQYSQQLMSSQCHFNDVSESNGQIHNDSKLYCSLLSGLPNELNFAFNVVTILSNCHRFDWTNDYKFINVLLESTKAYCCVCDHHDEMLTFGRDTFTDEDEALKVEKAIKSSFIKNKDFDKSTKRKTNGIIDLCSEKPNAKFEVPNFKKEIDYIEQKCNCYHQFWHQICTDENLINLIFKDSHEISCESEHPFKDLPQYLIRKIEERISLIGDIIRNVSFTYNQNNSNHVAMTPLLKFLVLMLKSENVKFVNISLDILSNIAPAFSFIITKPYEEEYLHLLHILFKNIVDNAINSNNIYHVTKVFEIMARYISATNHEANLLLETHFNNDKIYERITHLLTCDYDITLILALMEFCLVLSECRPYILVNNDSKTFLKILVNLLNCQAAQHFTTGALEKIKIIDTRPSEKSSVTPHTRNPTVPSQTLPPPPPPQPQTQSQPQPQPTALPNQPQMQNPINVVSNQPVPSQSIPASVVNPIQINLSQLDNESFAIHWLKTVYEEGPPNLALKINDIYAEYVKYCCRNSRRNVIAAQSFNFLLKRCFPASNINQVLIEGLVVKNQNISHEDSTKKSNPQNASSQMSPILKAHLSTPPKTQLGQNDPLPPTTTANASTLIKSLLANKLRNNQQLMSSQSNSSPPVVVTGLDSPKQPENNSQQKNIIIANQPPTSFSLTPSIFSNNLIVPTSLPSQTPNPPIPGSQQIFLVRTIITGPGQQNNNAPVRLLVPASMIAQPRLPNPGVNGVTNSSGTTNVPHQTTAPIMANQQLNTTQSLPQNAIPVIVPTSNTAPTQHSVALGAGTTPTKNSIVNSSPLLNVLLDKGKLPDFPNSNPSHTGPPQSLGANIVTPNVMPTQISNAIGQSVPSKPIIVIAQNAPKLGVDNTQKPASNVENKSSIPAVSATNPVVNGDTKTPVKINNSVKKKLDNTSEPCKKLKTAGCNETSSESQKSAALVPSNNQMSSTKSEIVQQARPIIEFECQWNNCQMKFSRPSDVFYHVHSQHIMVASCPDTMNCLWGGSEGRGPGCLSKRPKLSLLTHLQDFHCNPNVLKQESVRKRQLALMGTSNIVIPPPPAHPGYSQDAAHLAIRRSTSKTIEIMEPITPLTPLTVSIRLTSALILRNLAKRSHFIKKSLELFESQLCEISAAEGRDESRTIAQCLAVLNERK